MSVTSDSWYILATKWIVYSSCMFSPFHPFSARELRSVSSQRLVLFSARYTWFSLCALDDDWVILHVWNVSVREEVQLVPQSSSKTVGEIKHSFKLVPGSMRQSFKCNFQYIHFGNYNRMSSGLEVKSGYFSSWCNITLTIKLWACNSSTGENMEKIIRSVQIIFLDKSILKIAQC